MCLLTIIQKAPLWQFIHILNLHPNIPRRGWRRLNESGLKSDCYTAAVVKTWCSVSSFNQGHATLQCYAMTSERGSSRHLFSALFLSVIAPSRTGTCIFICSGPSRTWRPVRNKMVLGKGSERIGMSWSGGDTFIGTGRASPLRSSLSLPVQCLIT